MRYLSHHPSFLFPSCISLGNMQRTLSEGEDEHLRMRSSRLTCLSSRWYGKRRVIPLFLPYHPTLPNLETAALLTLYALEVSCGQFPSPRRWLILETRTLYGVVGGGNTAVCVPTGNPPPPFSRGSVAVIPY